MTFCVLGEKCSVFDRVTSTPGLTRTGTLCEGCRNNAERDLNLLRYDYVDLSQHIPRTAAPSDVRISRAKPASSPTIDLAVFTLRSRISSTVRAVETAVRARFGLSTPAAGREGFALDSAVRFLHPRVQDVARLSVSRGDFDEDVVELDGPGMVVLLGVLHRRSRRVCGLDPRTVCPPGDCPSCSVPALRRYDDDPGWIWCANCGRSLDREGYSRVVRMQVAAPVTPCLDPR